MGLDSYVFAELDGVRTIIAAWCKFYDLQDWIAARFHCCAHYENIPLATGHLDDMERDLNSGALAARNCAPANRAQDLLHYTREFIGRARAHLTNGERLFYYSTV